MALRERSASGLEYLSLASAILRENRRADPTGGLWEAADLQWWWRRDQHEEPWRQVFWLEGEAPIAASILTDWGDRLGCDLIGVGNDRRLLDVVWPVVLGQIAMAAPRTIEMTIREGDEALAAAAVEAGFMPTGEGDVTTWLDAADRPHPRDLPDGLSLHSRRDAPATPHHMIARNGEHVAERLAETSLYDPDLDLLVTSRDGSVASYALFWADPETGVGLLEPMRTEEPFQGRGVGKALLAAGLERLARRGCSRLKVSYIAGNEPARRLYVGSGFVPESRAWTYRLVR